MPTNAINDTGIKYLYDKLHGEIEPIAEAVSDSEVTIEGNPLSFNTLSSQNAKSTILTCEPIQDLHGYDKPWVGGAGKNLLPMTVESIKATNVGTWTGNSMVVENVTITILTDSDNNVTGIKLNGTAQNAFGFNITARNIQGFPAGSYIYNIQENVNINRFWVSIYSPQQVAIVAESEKSKTVTVNSGDEFGGGYIYSNAGNVFNNVIVQPMLRLSTESDATFQPYTNIASISGRSEIGILGCGKNLVDTSTFLNGFYDGNDWNFVSHNSYRSFKVFVKSGTWVLSTSESVGLRRIEIDGITSSYNEDITTYSITVSKDCYIGVSITKPSDSTTFQLEYGSQSTEYSAYQSSTDLTISLGQTVYGGTLDLENGVLVVDRGIIGANDFESFSTNTTTGGLKYAETETSGSKASGIGICNIAKVDNAHAWESTVPVAQISSTAGRIRFYCDATDRNDFLTKYANLQVCYELATPITIQLTSNEISLLEGVNNISTTGDKITLTYRDGKVATLGDLTSAVDSLDSKIDESKILTDTVTGDKYILVVTNGVLSVQQISN